MDFGIYKLGRITGRNIMIIFVLLLACSEPVDLETPDDENLLIIEGYITDEFGPHTINISRSARYGTVFEGFIQRINNATVLIRDSKGNSTILSQSGFGEYQTPSSFRGERGETYTLLVTTSVGENFASLPTTLTSGPNLEDVIFRFEKKPTSDDLNFTTGVNVFAKWNDPEGENNYHVFFTEGIHQIFTQPEDFVDLVARVPAPKDCCDECFIYDKNNSDGLYIHSDNNQDGREITTLAGFIEDDGKRFTGNYLLRVQMASLSDEAYAFYRLLDGQLAIDGDLFDAPPANIRGNLINLDNPQEQVLGFFGAYHSSSIIVQVPNEVIEEPARTILIPDDCRLIPNSSLDFPQVWN
jgi:hypothetical protein